MMGISVEVPNKEKEAAMRTLSNLANFSLILITFSLIALGASMVLIPDLLAELNNLRIKVREQENIIIDLREQIVYLQSSFIKHAELIKRIYVERNAALARVNELSAEIFMLKAHIASMTMAQRAAPFFPIVYMGVLFAANKIKKNRHQSNNVKAANDENTVTICMTRDQARAYSRWRREK